MSSEQPEVETQQDITQQETSPAPKQHVKNPKRVAAGKLVAKRTREAREQQKKALSRAESIIEKNKEKASAPEPDPPSGLTFNQWIGIGGLVVSAAGLFLKREELMAAFKKNICLSLLPLSLLLRERAFEKWINFPLFYTMSCKHDEDVCQHCLEKVHITEDSPTKLSPKEKEHSHAGKTMTPKEKRNRILFDSSLLVGFGAIGFFCTKLYSKISAHIFDSSLKVINRLWDTFETPSRKE